MTVLDDAYIRRADGHRRLRPAVEVVPPNDGFVPPGTGEPAIARYLR